MPSDDSLLCRMSGARPGIAPKVIRAFPAARRQLRRRASALRGRRNIDLSNALELLPAAGLTQLKHGPVLIQQLDGWRWTVRDIYVS